MRRAVVLMGIVAVVAGCSIPFRTNSAAAKSQCDRVAAQAIQTSSAAEARDFALQASECYSRIAS